MINSIGQATAFHYGGIALELMETFITKITHHIVFLLLSVNIAPTLICVSIGIIVRQQAKLFQLYSMYADMWTLYLRTCVHSSL